MNLEDQIKKAHEILKKCTEEPTKENANELIKAAMNLEPFESMAIMAIALRIELYSERSFKQILLVDTPEWIRWCYKYREHLDTTDFEKNRVRRNEIVQELGIESSVGIIENPHTPSPYPYG